MNSAIDPTILMAGQDFSLLTRLNKGSNVIPYCSEIGKTDSYEKVSVNSLGSTSSKVSVNSKFMDVVRFSLKHHPNAYTKVYNKYKRDGERYIQKRVSKSLGNLHEFSRNLKKIMKKKPKKEKKDKKLRLHSATRSAISKRARSKASKVPERLYRPPSKMIKLDDWNSYFHSTKSIPRNEPNTADLLNMHNLQFSDKGKTLKLQTSKFKPIININSSRWQYAASEFHCSSVGPEIKLPDDSPTKLHQKKQAIMSLRTNLSSKYKKLNKENVRRPQKKDTDLTSSKLSTIRSISQCKEDRLLSPLQPHKKS